MTTKEINMAWAVRQWLLERGATPAEMCNIGTAHIVSVVESAFCQCSAAGSNNCPVHGHYRRGEGEPHDIKPAGFICPNCKERAGWHLPNCRSHGGGSDEW